MLKSYFVIAWRNLLRHRLFSLVNVLGLSVSVACAMLIIFHIKEELSYDKGYPKAERLFRITMESLDDGRHWAATSPVMGLELAREFPEVEQLARFYRRYPFQVFSHTAPDGAVKRFQEKQGFFADPEAVTMFNLRFASGDPETALTVPDAIVLSAETARKYFGDEDVLGKILHDDIMNLSLKVTGVLKEHPFPSHLNFDYLVSMATIHRYLDEGLLGRRTWNGFYNYVLLDKSASKEAIEAKLPEFNARFYQPNGLTREEALSARRLHLQPIADIHLRSKMEKELYVSSDITYVYIFSVIAFVILLIAAVNFINISTTLAFSRMKEIGLRKVAGAGKLQLIRQFLGESFLVTLLAVLLALLLFKSGIPFYNGLTGKQFRFEELFSVHNLTLLLLLIAVTGTLTGLYPAWFVSRLNPVTSLKSQKGNKLSVHLLRKGLIVFQFVISVCMIFSTLVIYRQMQFFHHKNLGFDREQLVGINIYGDMWDRFGILINKMQQNAAIDDFSAVSTLPGERFNMQTFIPLDIAAGKELPSTRAMWGDERLLSTLGISLKEGRNFANQFPEIKRNEFLLNETAVKAFGLEEPVGKRCVLNTDTGIIVGVVKDFNFASLHSGIAPMVIQYNPYRANYLLVKIKAGQVPQTLRFLESNIRSLSPTSVFNYSFMDDRLNRLYEAENRMMQLFKAFSAFAIFVSCLGLFGLAAFTSRQRTKEIGIRKVLGATAGGLAALLCKDFIRLVGIAIVIASPIAWYVMDRWLEGFAYRIELEWWMLPSTGLLAVGIALLTVSLQSVKAALTNPVKSLRSE